MTAADERTRVLRAVISVMRWAVQVLRADPRRTDDVKRVLEQAADDAESALDE